MLVSQNVSTSSAVDLGDLFLSGANCIAAVLLTPPQCRHGGKSAQMKTNFRKSVTSSPNKKVYMRDPINEGNVVRGRVQMDD